MLLGIPERAVMDMMGWSNGAMAKRYQHVTAALRQDVATPARKLPLGDN